MSFEIDRDSDLWNGVQVGGINGVNTSFQEALNHAEYIRQFVSNLSIQWVYNQSHGLLLDGLEVILLNYGGCSPNTSKQLTENWTLFHKENENNPHRKYLQICHSQGAAHVRNALAEAPRNIRERVIVVAIAPAVIIPDKSCFKSYNYASERDLVPNIELVRLGFFDTNEFGTSKVVEMALEQRKELKRLSAHEGAMGLDHDFQSPTFAKIIKEHLEDYESREGVYQ